MSEIDQKNQLITERLFDECWHVKIPSNKYATECRKCGKRIEQSHQTGFDRNYNFYANSKDRQKLLDKIAELNMQDAFVREVCKTPLPVGEGFDAIYLWGMLNLSLANIADAVIRMLEKQTLESAAAGAFNE